MASAPTGSTGTLTSRKVYCLRLPGGVRREPGARRDAKADGAGRKTSESHRPKAVTMNQ